MADEQKGVRWIRSRGAFGALIAVVTAGIDDVPLWLSIALMLEASRS